MDNQKHGAPDSAQALEEADNLRLPFNDNRVSLIADFKLKLRKFSAPFRHRFLRISRWFNAKFKDLSFSQWCYFLAAIMLLSFLSEPQEDDDYMLVVGVIAGVGLLRELWQTFMRIWEHTLGKGVLFVLYASTANIALAVSALKINSISGIEPQTFVFTMGFTTMLMLPFWLLLASVFFLGSAIILLSLWSLLSFVLRIFRIKLRTHWEDKSFALLTMWMRIVFIPFLMMVLYSFMEPYIEQLNVFDEPIFSPSESLTSLSQDELLSIADIIRNQEQQALTEEQKSLINDSGLSTFELGMLRNMSEEDLGDLSQLIKSGELAERIKNAKSEASDEDSRVFSLNLSRNKSKSRNNDDATATDSASVEQTQSSNNETTDNQASNADDEEERARTLDTLIATFIYQFETYRYSACRKEEKQRVLTIDENTIFVIEKDKTQDLGYKFSVAACIPQWAEE